MNSYDLSRNFFNWSFENPELVSPALGSLYFFCIEHSNRLGNAKKFGLPFGMAMSAIGVSNRKTYYKALNDLVKYEFITIITQSSNQYSATIISINDKKRTKNTALDKAVGLKCLGKKYPSNDTSIVTSNDTSIVTSNDTSIVTSNDTSTVHITKPINQITNKPNNQGASAESETLENLFLEFLDMRKKMRKPATPRAIELLKLDLKKLAPENASLQKLIILQSIKNNWQGFFALKNNSHPYQQPTNPNPSTNHHEI
jgi:hypothetical protein